MEEDRGRGEVKGSVRLLCVHLLDNISKPLRAHLAPLLSILYQRGYRARGIRRIFTAE
jgi:hypothetical protein